MLSVDVVRKTACMALPRRMPPKQRARGRLCLDQLSRLFEKVASGKAERAGEHAVAFARALRSIFAWRRCLRPTGFLPLDKKVAEASFYSGP